MGHFCQEHVVLRQPATNGSPRKMVWENPLRGKGRVSFSSHRSEHFWNIWLQRMAGFLRKCGWAMPVWPYAHQGRWAASLILSRWTLKHLGSVCKSRAAFYSSSCSLIVPCLDVFQADSSLRNSDFCYLVLARLNRTGFTALTGPSAVRKK